MGLAKKIFGMAFLALTAPHWAMADQQQLQIGYVFSGWTSNSLYSGTEHRVPLSYSFTTPNFGFSLGTAFVAGDYKNTGGGIDSEYNSSQFSDSTIGMNVNFNMGNSMKSSLVGSLNIPTGDTTWEAREEIGAVPNIFEPSYYHGRGFGGNLFYTLDASGPGSELGLGLGYMATTSYDTGIPGLESYYPGDTVLAIGTFGFKMSSADTWGFRVIHTFPLESTNADPNLDFTPGQSSIFTTQWVSQMGTDKLSLNLSYALYNRGFSDSLTNLGTLEENAGAFFGDRMTVHPIMGYVLGKDLSMETGLIWERVFQNGYSFGDPNFVGGGNLFGAEQSLTFQLNPGTFWNIAGLYHYIENDNAGVNRATINYQRFTIGTNVGLKW